MIPRDEIALLLAEATRAGVLDVGDDAFFLDWIAAAEDHTRRGAVALGQLATLLGDHPALRARAIDLRARIGGAS